VPSLCDTLVQCPQWMPWPNILENGVTYIKPNSICLKLDYLRFPTSLRLLHSTWIGYIKLKGIQPGGIDVECRTLCNTTALTLQSSPKQNAGHTFLYRATLYSRVSTNRKWSHFHPFNLMDSMFYKHYIVNFNLLHKKIIIRVTPKSCFYNQNWNNRNTCKIETLQTIRIVMILATR
jgi:hypothetical protein